MSDLSLDEFSFNLPAQLIAQEPAARREDSRLLIIRKNRPAGMPLIEDSKMSELPSVVQFEELAQDHLWVRNTSKVFPARFYAKRDSGGVHEIVLVEPQQDGKWSALIRKQARLRYPQTLTILNSEQVTITVHEGGLIEFPFNSQSDLFSFLDEVGEMPLPPYIEKRDQARDVDRYQPVWANPEKVGSVAAPTASLHFSDSLIEGLLARGVSFADLVLHVGLGTFEPLRSESIKENKLHYESFQIAAKQIEKIKKAKKCLCVGTTALRTIESMALFEEGASQVEASLDSFGNMLGRTQLFIQPGYKFRHTKALLSNFHLPKSSLFILVCAFAESRKLALEAYQHAIDKKYRFFSYGDATLWL